MKYLLLLFFCLPVQFTNSQQLVPYDEGSRISFTIKNFGIGISGEFKGMKGMISFDPASIAAAVFDVSIDANSINTNNKSRDSHLKKEEYFWVEKYPLINLASTKVTSTGKTGSFMVQGKLSIKGITKNISFPFTAEAQKDGYRFTGMFTINRRDFNIGGRTLVISDNLTVSLSVLAKNKSN